MWKVSFFIAFLTSFLTLCTFRTLELRAYASFSLFNFPTATLLFLLLSLDLHKQTFSYVFLASFFPWSI